MSSENLTVPAPKIVNRHYAERLLCGAGPSASHPSVLEALTKPTLSPICDELFNVMADIRAGIQYLYQTRSKAVLALSGPGNVAMETVITNLLEPGETILIACRGFWDERALEMAKRRGCKTAVTQVPLTDTFTFEQLEDMLKRVQPTALFITHGDSTTGTVQKIKGLGKLCHKYGALLLMDTVVSIAAERFLMDEWEVDAVYSSTQKALSGPAGISAVAFSARAEDKIKGRLHEPLFCSDIKLLTHQWNCYGGVRIYHHTISSPLLWALRCCLQEVIKETLPVSWDRHATATAYFHKRLQELPVQFLIPKPEDRLRTVTTVVLPNGYDYNDFMKYMREKHNIVVYPGAGPTAGKALRIGIMGVNANLKVVDTLINAMADTLRALKKSSL